MSLSCLVCFSLCSKDDFVVQNSIFRLFEKLLIPPLNLIDNPDRESILGCTLFPFMILNVSYHFGLQGFCWKLSWDTYGDSLVIYILLFFCWF